MIKEAAKESNLPTLQQLISNGMNVTGIFGNLYSCIIQ